MKKLVFIAIALFLTGAAFSQTTTPPITDKKNDMKDIRHDIRDVRKDERQRREELREGDKREAKQLTRDIRKDKKDIAGDRRDLRQDGVKHPIRRADRQIYRRNKRF